MFQHPTRMVFYYNNLVDWEKRLKLEGPFLIEQLRTNKAKKIMDCGCGIGKHTVYLRKNGFAADGCDLNPLHVEESAKQAKEEHINANFYVEDVTTLKSIIENEYDAYLLIGNFLAALGKESARKALSRIHSLLPRGGVVIGQLLNFESFDKQDKTDVRTTMPDGEEVIYLKTFHFEKDHLSVILNVLRKDGEKWYNTLDSTNMYFLNKAFFDETFKKIGYSQVNYYGKLDGRPLENSSRDLVFVAVK